MKHPLARSIKTAVSFHQLRLKPDFASNEKCQSFIRLLDFFFSGGETNADPSYNEDIKGGSEQEEIIQINYILQTV